MRDHATESSAAHPTPPVSITGSSNIRPAGLFVSSGDTATEDTPMEDHQQMEEPVSATTNLTDGHSKPTSASNPNQSTQHTNDSLGVIGAGVKVLLHAINDLARHGIDTTIPLPKVVVVGNQSAGKSSLIEAISEIKVPRDVGTCTRCPLQITLIADESDNSSWQCDVTLQKRYTYSNPDQSNSIDPETNEPYPFFPWMVLPSPEITRFGTVRNKNNLEDVIRAAQVATLNPHEDPKTYMGLKVEAGRTLVEFSPNLICLEISGPGLPNLTFYDLPGVIAQTRDVTNTHAVKLVKNLVRQYIQEENTLILLAAPMDAEIENATACVLVRKAGGNDRCIGVLTKPDRLPGNDRVEHWNSVLRGDGFELGYGYFVTRQPSQTELKAGITHAQARELEQQFFESPFWTSQFRGFEERQGTLKLQRFLSDLLARLILKCLPEIRARVIQKIAEADHKLAQLPDPPHNALQVVTTTLSNFVNKLQQLFEGGFASNSLWKSWKSIKKDFGKAIEDQRPVLLVEQDTGQVKFAKGTQKTNLPAKRNNEGIINIDIDDDAVPETPTKKHKGRNGKVTPSTARTTPSTVRTTPMPFRTREMPDANRLRKRFSPNEIRSHLDDFSTSGLPGGIDLKAVDQMILASLVNWEIPTTQLLEKVEKELKSGLELVLNDVASKWTTTGLFCEMQRYFAALVMKYIDDQHKRQIPRLLHLETRKPLTENVEVWKLHKSREVDVLTTGRLKARVDAYLKEQDALMGKTTDKEDRSKRIQADKELSKKVGEDPYEREIEAMAVIRAYYAVAASRFVDNVCQSVEVDLFDHFHEGLHEELEEALGIHGPNCQEVCAQLLEDDPERARQRVLLKDQKARLQEAKHRLDQLEVQFGANNDSFAFIPSVREYS